MHRRQLLRWGCAHCAALAGVAGAQTWDMPARLVAPALDTDEGGLWALMEREERRLRRSPFVMRDTALQRYLEGIVLRLVGEHAQDMRVFPIRQAMFNASMAPNGMMQVWSGLLLRVENEAQLASVIGHEIGHFFQRHTLERLRDAKSRSAFASFMGIFGVVGLIGVLGMVAGQFGFSRDQERDADRIGLQLMRKAGYDTRQAARIWENLNAEMAASDAGDPSKTNILFATHPGGEERQQTLSTLAMGDEPGGYVGQDEFWKALGGVRLQLLEDEVRRSEPGQSLVLLDRLLAQQPVRADLLHFRGEVRRLRDRSGDTELAQADLEMAAAQPDALAVTFRSLGHLWRQRGVFDKAREAYQQYLTRLPTAPDAELIQSELKGLT